MNVPSETLVVSEARGGMQLDEFLCLAFPHLTKGFVRRQVRAGRVLVDGMETLPSRRLRSNDVVSVDFEEVESVAPVAPPRPVPILYEDEQVLAVDKPAGLAVEPERWARDVACLSGALLAMAIESSRAAGREEGTDQLEFRPRLVHRIDKDTTGVVLVAKTLGAERSLRRAFERGTVEKNYLALVDGEYPLEDGEVALIDRPIAPDARRSGRMRACDEGKPSRTRVSIEERFRGFTWLRCEPLTGRTHQIRVHLADQGFPLSVDHVYGRRDELLLSELKRDYRRKPGSAEHPLLGRLSLHAAAVRFPRLDVDGEPLGSERVDVRAPLPKDLTRTLKQLAKVRPPRP